jgi:hypothetical protein
MKKVLIILLSLFTLSVGAATYYVAPTGGSDSNLGTITQPWATWQKGFETAVAGDTVYFRGGTWYPITHHRPGYAITEIDPDQGIGHNGTHDNPICFFNYSGETPTLDCFFASLDNTGNIGLNINEATYLKFKGLTIKNARQLLIGSNCTGIEMSCHGPTIHSVVSFENIVVHDIGGTGIQIGGYDTLYLTNTDVYEVCDSLDATSPGGDGDGYNITSGGTAVDTFKIAYITGCRAWRCSDDGIDASTTMQFHFSNCWFFNNGYQFLLTGDGTGIKFATSGVFLKGKRVVNNCLAAFNHHTAYCEVNLFDAFYGPKCEYYNNVAYKCEYGYVVGSQEFNCVTGKGGTVLQNNIFINRDVYYALFGVCDQAPYIAKYLTLDHNNFRLREGWPYSEINPTYTVTDADFVLTDSTEAIEQLTASRKPDGSLPNITFLKLTSTSDLIDAGIDVGYTFNGSAPDLGYSEYYSGQITINPIVVSTTGVYPGTTKVTSGGNVTDDGGGTVSARGVCWGSSFNPSITGNHTSDGEGTGIFSSAITGLTSETIYHVRAYATNEVGTSYGNDIQFMTRKDLFIFQDGKPVFVNGKIATTGTGIYVGPKPVTSISVFGTGEATTISVNGGTLQMLKKTLPTNADDTTATWSRTNGTGVGSINSSGLLTALTDGTVTVRATANDGSSVYGEKEITISNQSVTSQIIADHTIVDRFDDIPSEYMTAVKKMRFVIAGESHSTAYITGLVTLEDTYPAYDIGPAWYVSPELYTEEHLRADRYTWGDVDNATGWLTSYGEEDWITSSTAISRTKANLTYNNHNGLDLTAIGFGWCYDSDITDATDYLAATQSYINYCADSIPAKVYFTTGPVDYWNSTGEMGYNKYLLYEAIRNYVDGNSTRILFDYADILCYDDDGSGPNTATWNGHTYPVITTRNLGTQDYGHIGMPGTIRLAKAVWWMLARMAGWDGN